MNDLSVEDRAKLYSNRSASYLGIYQKEPDVCTSLMDIAAVDHEDPRYRALYDAKQVISLWPNWWRGYYRAGKAYTALNKLQKAIIFLDRSLAMEPSIQEIREARDEARFKLANQRTIRDQFNCPSIPMTTEDVTDEMNRTGLNVSPEVIDNLEALLISLGDAAGDVIRAGKYLNGMGGLPQDYERAVAYYSKAAAKGNVEGMYHLALLTMEGKGVKKDVKFAVELLHKAAQQPPLEKNGTKNVCVAESQFMVANCYKDGVGLTKDPSLAIVWYERASKNGHPAAAYCLGIAHMNGHWGVHKDSTKAVQYLKLAASRRNSDAMESLAHYYVENGHIEKAKHWYERAMANGNQFAAFKKEEFDMKVAKWENSDDLKTLSEWESLNGVDTGDMCLWERVRQMKTSTLTNPEERQVYNEVTTTSCLKEYTLPGTVLESQPSSSLFAKYDYSTVAQYAKLGWKFAKTMLEAMDSLKEAIHVLKRSVSKPKFSSDEADDQEFVQRMANAIRVQHIVILGNPAMIQSLFTRSLRVLKLRGKSQTQLDKDARVCYVFSLYNSLTESLAFLQECLEKYKDDPFFLIHYGNICCFKEDYEKAEKAFRKAQHLDSNNYEVLFSIAKVLQLKLEQNVDEIIATFEAFLAAAPEDHRHYPEAYYSIALASFTKMSTKKDKDKTHLMSKHGRNVMTRIKNYYELGLQAEKKQLPFFLPYESNNKILMGNLVRSFDYQLGKPDVPKAVQKSTMPPPNRPPQMTLEKLSDPWRVEIIQNHRSYKRQLKEMYSECRSGFCVPLLMPGSGKAPKQQKAPTSLVGLKPIALRDMDPTKDHIYEGTVLEMMMIDDASIGDGSVSTVIQDVNGDAHRCYIYNYEHQCNDAMVQQKFGFGTKMNLMNPYMRMAHDGKPAIRVDDPVSFLELGKSERLKKLCRFCLTDNAPMTCAKCKRANYCNRECQTKDWKLYKHKFICDSSSTAVEGTASSRRRRKK